MESNPFSPAFPPRRAFFLALLTSFFLLSASAHAGFVANYSTLKNRSRTEALVYVQNVQRILKSSNDLRISCKMKQASSEVLCRKYISRQQLQKLLQHPEFSRMRWNAESIKVSTACNKDRTETCKKLLNLKGRFFRTERRDPSL